MEIRCPHCNFRIVIKGVKPGGYRLPCSQCKEHFIMVVALVDDHRLVLLGETLEALKPVRGLEHQPHAPAAPSPAMIEYEAVAIDEPTLTRPPAPHGAASDHVVAQEQATLGRPMPPAPGRRSQHDGARDGDHPPQRSAAQRAAAAASQPALTGRLDGYELLKLIGRGGMGSVYLARQLSLDRLVAIKTISPEWAGDAVFLSRFTREAHAAAQLTHHNMVQIHDIGEDRGTHYFSMELVTGQSLAELLREQGRLDVEQATGYILHAARGLKFAHDHGMVHRDIKPANLLLNHEGIVKVADMGLVKTADDAITLSQQAGQRRAGAGDALLTSAAAMGTPAYMAPEQIENAANVDGRADIYSLGCTFYALTTGRPVFEGNTAEEVMTKHATEAVIPPEQIASRVPRSISSIILNMVAKHPADRFASMKDVIEALEHFLGISAGPFTPREQHVQILEEAVQSFYASSHARLRRWLMLGFMLGCIAWAGWGLATARPTWVAVAVGLWFCTGLSYAALTGITQKTAVARKVRQLIFGSSLRDWLAWTLIAAAIVAALVLLNLHWLAVGVLVIGAALAAAFHFSMDYLVGRERQPHMQAVRQMLKQLRLRGLEEDAVRRFVCRYSGRHWEAFYEALFDYDAKLAARRHWGTDEDGRPRPKYATWRDGLIEWINHRQQLRQQARQQKHIQKIEARRLQAEGRSEDEARFEAQTVAQAMVNRAAQYKQTGEWRGAVTTTDALDDDDLGDYTGLHQPTLLERVTGLLLGGRARLLVGIALLVVYASWAQEHGLAERLRASASFAEARRILNVPPDPLLIPGVPAVAMRLLCGHGAVLAGMLLVVTAFYRGRRMTLCLLPALAVLIAGPMLSGMAPQPGPLSSAEVIASSGLLLGVAGWWIGKR